MAKIILIVLGVLFLLIAAAMGGVYLWITSSSTVAAQVYVESPSVLVNGAVVSGTVHLKEGDVIETKDGSATVFLYESVVVNLKPETKVTVKDLQKKHPKLSQEGKTWNTFTKLAGVEEYSMEAADSVASVRATAFSLEDGKIITGEGVVFYDLSGKEFTVTAGRVVKVIDGAPVERDMTSEEAAEVRASMQRAIESLKKLRWLEVEKKKFLISKLMEQNGFTDDELKEALDELDGNNKDLDELRKEIPVRIDSLDKVLDITEAIRKISGYLEDLS